MLVKIDIGGQIEEQEFDKTDILVGSSQRADINLNFEGIGDLHLKIQLTGDNFQVTDLNSGHATFIDSDMLGPGESANLTDSSEIEIGGVYLSVSEKAYFKKDLFRFETDSKLQIEEDTTQSIDHLLKETKANIVDPEKLRKIEEDLARAQFLQADEAENKEQFKQDIFSSVSVPSAKTTEKELRRKEPQVKNRKDIKIRKGKKNNQSLAFLALLILAGTSFLYYEYIHKENSVLTPANSMSQLKLTANIDKGFNAHKDKLEAFVKSQQCGEDKLLTTCDLLRNTLGISGIEWKVLQLNNTLIVGVEDGQLETQLNNLFSTSKVETSELKEVIQSQYSDYFSFDEFVANQYLPPLRNYTYKRDESRDLFFILTHFLKHEIPLTPGIDTLFLFTYSNFSGEIAPQHFLEMSRISYMNELKLKDSALINLQLGWEYHLTEDLDVMISGIGSTKKISFNPEVALNAKVVASKRTLKKLLEFPKCDLLPSICQSIEARRVKSPYEGAVIDDRKLVIYFDLSSIRDNFLNKSYPEYTNADRRNLIEALGDMPIEQKKQFQENGYVNTNPNFELNAELLIADFFIGNYVQEIFKLQGLDSIALVGVTQNFESEPQIEYVVDAPIDAYKEINILKVNSKIPYLIKSKVPLFQAITSKTSIPTKF